MLLSDIFEQLVSGELAQLNMGDIDDLTVNVEDYPKVIPSMNLALVELYKRFPIRVEEVIIRQKEQLDTYVLHSKYAVSNTSSTEPIKYIHDSIYEPFQDNVLRVEQAFNELGVELPINEEVDYAESILYQDTNYQPFIGAAGPDYSYQSIKTPTYNSIQILPHPEAENNILVKYRAAPIKIPVSQDIIPGEIEIDLPLAMLEPLLLYVGGRVYANMHGEDANSGAGYIAKFEASCIKIEELNLFNKGNRTNTKLDRAGWK